MRVVTRYFARVSRNPFYQEHCYYAMPMMGWFISSALLSAYNKYVFGNSGKVAFPCPLLLTSLHFACQWIVSHRLCQAFPEATGLPRLQQLSWKEFWSISIPCGLVTAADVGLSNLSMVSISLTFYTMVKASAPIFVLFWAYVFQIERITWPLLAVVAVIAVGEFLTVFGETHFVLTGFLQCLAASVLSGARWTLVQLKLQTLEPPLKTSLATMRVLAPSMFGGLLVVALAIEQPWQHLGWDEAGFVLLLGSIGGTFAIAMTLCEFMLIMQASAIILMIGGVVKELLNIGIGMAFFGDTLNWINTVGFTIVFGGVILYKLTFHGPVSSSEAVPPVPVVEHYGPVAHNDSSSSPSPRRDALRAKSSNDNDDDDDDEEYAHVEGKDQQGDEDGQDQLQDLPRDADLMQQDVAFHHRRPNSTESNNDLLLRADSDQVELHESKSGTLT
uniref:Sugar phosphate transporter domain-containing protein n=1 Tax=Amphora coffeiformis TaxID=265554 RepID=A0A7S3KXW7_9STRA